MAYSESENVLTDRQGCFLCFISYLILHTGGLICLSIKGTRGFVRKGLSLQCIAHPTCLAASRTRDQHVRGSGKSEICRGPGTRDTALLFPPIALNTASWIGHSQHREAQLVFPIFYDTVVCLILPLGVANPHLTTS